MKYKFIDQAMSEFDDAMAFYESRVPGLGSELFNDFENTLERLLQFPKSSSRLSAEIRQAVLSHYPFNIIYKIEDDLLRIIAFMHQKRKPGYWKKRLISRN